MNSKHHNPVHLSVQDWTIMMLRIHITIIAYLEFKYY